MKKLTYSLLFLVLLLGSNAFGQTLLATTTTSAVQGRGTGTITLTSATNLTIANSYLYVDGEVEQVVSIPASGTIFPVIRGVSGTAAHQHQSTALVFIVPPAASGYALVSQNPLGACARGGATVTGGVQQAQSTLYLPIINTRTAEITDCVGGVFLTGQSSYPQSSQFRVLAPNAGAVAYTSLNTNGTTLAATTMYCVEADLPYNKYVTGIGILNGTTATTDNHLVALYDSTGNLLANSAAAGVLAATASDYQKIAFTSPYYAVGPAQYFACMQTNGTTATVRMIVTGTQDTYLTKGVTGQTFGTIPATITVPTTFTTAVGPYSYLY